MIWNVCSCTKSSISEIFHSYWLIWRVNLAKKDNTNVWHWANPSLCIRVHTSWFTHRKCLVTEAFTLQNRTSLARQPLNDAKVLNWLTTVDESDTFSTESTDWVSKLEGFMWGHICADISIALALSFELISFYLHFAWTSDTSVL